MTILNQTVELIQKGYTWGIDWNSYKFWLLLIGGLILILFFGWVLFDNSTEKIGLKLFCISTILFGIFSTTMAFHTKPVYKEIRQYEVLLDDIIPFHEVYDNYDLIEQRGQIFVLRERGWENDG